MKDCLPFIALNIILIGITVTFFIMNINLQKKLDALDLVKVYKIKGRDTLSNITQIRKSNGDSCNISRLYEPAENIDEVRKNGEACI